MKTALLILAFTSLCLREALAEDTSHDSNTVIITMRNGQVDTGRVLFAWDSVLVLWKSYSPYSAGGLTQFAKAEHISEIRRVTVINESYFWSGVGAGALVGFLGGFSVGAWIGSAADSSTFIGVVGFAAAVGVIAAVPCALYFGIKAAINGIDDTYLIDGDTNTYHRGCLQRVLRCTLITTQPPPEIEAFIKEKYAR